MVRGCSRGRNAILMVRGCNRGRNAILMVRGCSRGRNAILMVQFSDVVSSSSSSSKGVQE